MHLNVLLDAEHPFLLERRHGLGGDDGAPPVPISFTGGHVSFQREVGSTSDGGHARARGVARMPRRVHAVDEEEEEGGAEQEQRSDGACFAVAGEVDDGGEQGSGGAGKRKQERKEEAGAAYLRAEAAP